VGQAPVITGTGKRFRVNMLSAVSNGGMLRFRLFTGSFTGAVFIDFLGRLLRDCGGRKVHLIVDGHPVHRAKAVNAWVGRHGERIQLQFLPGYSPELNPVELLNMTSRRMPRAGGVPGRRRRVAMSCTGICVVASGSHRSWSASLITRRPAMPPHDHTICLPW
jgi:DDE superfamily endonuclease